MTTAHPCAGMSDAARAAFERIALGQNPGCPWSVLDELIGAGLVVRLSGEKRRDALGIYEVPSFAVPIAVHLRWCMWCAGKPETGGM